MKEDLMEVRCKRRGDEGGSTIEGEGGRSSLSFLSIEMRSCEKKRSYGKKQSGFPSWEDVDCSGFT